MENIGFLGGDKRNIRLAELLNKKGHEVYTYGLEKAEFKYEKIKKTSINEMIENVTTIFSSIPFSKDGEYISAPYSLEKIKIKELLPKLKNKKLIAGAIDNDLLKFTSKYNIQVIDLLGNEALTILNAIPTAEGAIKIAIEKSERTLHGSKVLVLGFGRIGKILAKILLGTGAKVTCEARKESDLAWIKAYGYEAIKLEDLNKKIGEYDIIFNTIPSIILDEKKLKLLNKETIIIDLASKPGGVDFKKAEELGVKASLELGLPGRIAPISSAEYIYNVVLEKNILK